MNERIEWLKHPEYVKFMMEFIPGHTEAEIRQAFDERFGIVLTEANIGNFKYKYKIKSGTHGGRFSKGHTPFNKGKKMPSEIYERCKGTMFKNGQMPHNHKPVGSERINVDGYVEVKTKESKRWRLKQRVLYEQYHGVKLEKNDVVLFLDGNRQNFEISNLVKMTRAELARYNQDHFYGDDSDINRCAVGIAKLKTKVGELKNGTD